MSSKLVLPNFNEGDIELRFENDVVCIYGTAAGLKILSDFCLDLIKKPRTGHIHLEDYEILTKKSLIGALAIFNKDKN